VKSDKVRLKHILDAMEVLMEYAAGNVKVLGVKFPGGHKGKPLTND
jgi:hypothetical protein